ncbi:hypothetical protein DYB25_014032, partial [Aphanomyces astaci]
VSERWPATTVGGVELKAFANIIPHQLDLGLIFRLGGDAADLPKPESIYVFRGMVCYYGQHYVSFFKSQSKAHECGTRLSFTAPLPSLHRTPTSPLASHPSWEVLRAPVASSPDGKCRYIVRLTAQDGGLGLVVGDDISSLEPPSESSSDPHPPRRLMITALETSNSKRPLLPAVACGVICVGDQLLQVDGEVVEDESWTAWTAMERLVTAAGPVTLTLARAVPWSCSHCTLINDVGATTCAACDRPLATAVEWSGIVGSSK